MTLIEIVIAMAVLAVAILALILVMTSASTLQQATRETSLAYNHARKLLEEMRSVKFTEVYTRYKAGGTPGNKFHVTELIAPAGVPTGWKDGYCEIIFPEDPPGTLNETVNESTLGMPKDLNQDGDADDTDVTADHKILPVKIVIRWRTIGNRDSRIEVDSFITER